MKFYDLDLSQLLPDNIPLNTSSHVEYTGFINEFFLRGFHDYYNQLFNYSLGLNYDYSRSCMGLYSRYASMLSSDNQLKDRIEDAGANFYSTNSHEAAAYFAHELATMQIGSVDALKTFIHYAANSYALNADIIYEGHQTYCYGLHLYGDITASANIEATLTRLLQLLVVFTPIHTKLEDVEFEDTATDLNVYGAVVGDDVSYMYEAHLPVPIRERIVIGQTTTVPKGTTKLVSKYWWMDNFQYADGMSNLWTPNEFAGDVNNMTGMVDIDGTEFNEAVFTDNGSMEDFSDNGWQLKLNMYNSKPEMWTDSGDSVSDPSKCGIIVLAGASPTWTTDTEWELPSTLYTINGTTVTWNHAHVLMNLFAGSYGYAVGEA